MLSILITEATKIKSTVILKVPEPRAKTLAEEEDEIHEIRWNQKQKHVPCIPECTLFFLSILTERISCDYNIHGFARLADLNRRTGEFHRPLDIFWVVIWGKILFGTNKSFLFARTEAASQCKCWVKTNVHIDEVLDHRCWVRLKTTAA